MYLYVEGGRREWEMGMEDQGGESEEISACVCVEERERKDKE